MGYLMHCRQSIRSQARKDPQADADRCFVAFATLEPPRQGTFLDQTTTIIRSFWSAAALAFLHQQLHHQLIVVVHCSLGKPPKYLVGEAGRWR
jgi:hypothetical protein